MTDVVISAAAADVEGAQSLADVRLRLAVEDFLTYDAALLDGWQLQEWLELFTEDSHYLVPATGWPDGDPAHDLFFVQDDLFLLTERVTSILNGTAWAESPLSTTHRVVGNVRVKRLDDGSVQVIAKGIAHRASGKNLDVFPYTLHLDLLLGGPAGFRIRNRRAVLGLEQLRPHGRVSILL